MRIEFNVGGCSRRLEHLLAGNEYSDAVNTPGDEIAAGMLERALASATVTGASEPISKSLNPSMLAYTGRQLKLHGESLQLIQVSSGRLLLHPDPAQIWEVFGTNPEPDRRNYDVYCPTQTGQSSKRVSSLDVVHAKAGSSRDTPWAGRSALRNAADHGTGHARIEQCIGKELKGRAGRVLPVPADPADDTGLNQIKAVLKALAGGLLIVESMASVHVNALRSDTRLSGDWAQRRIGPDHPRSVVQMRNNLQASAGVVLGIPANLLRRMRPVRQG